MFQIYLVSFVTVILKKLVKTIHINLMLHINLVWSMI